MSERNGAGRRWYAEPGAGALPLTTHIFGPDDALLRWASEKLSNGLTSRLLRILAAVPAVSFFAYGAAGGGAGTGSGVGTGRWRWTIARKSPKLFRQKYRWLRSTSATATWPQRSAFAIGWPA